MNLIEVIKENPGITQTNLASKCDINYNTLYYRIKKLIEKGKIRREIKGKGRHTIAYLYPLEEPVKRSVEPKTSLNLDKLSSTGIKEKNDLQTSQKDVRTKEIGDTKQLPLRPSPNIQEESLEPFEESLEPFSNKTPHQEKEPSIPHLKENDLISHPLSQGLASSFLSLPTYSEIIAFLKKNLKTYPNAEYIYERLEGKKRDRSFALLYHDLIRDVTKSNSGS